MTEKYALRPYQTDSINACLAEIKKKSDARVIVQLPTGTGKTVCFSTIIARLNVPTLVIAHRKELLTQAAEKIERSGIPSYRINIVLQSRPDPDALVWVASVQTIVRGDRMQKIQPQLIVIDEAHHSCASTYTKVLEQYPGIPVIGYTATPTRKTPAEKKLLADMWDKLVYQMSIKKAILEKYLAPLSYYKVKTDINLDRVKTTAGDFNEGDLAESVNIGSRNQATVAKYLELGGGKAICFAVNLEHAMSLRDVFAVKGVRALYVDGKTKQDERDSRLGDFARAGHMDNIVICNCGVLTEGYDCPDVRQVILARPTKSPILYLQMLGRGTRTAPGKEACIVVDIADNYSKPDLCSCLRTVFNLRKGIEVEGDILSRLGQKARGTIETEEELDQAVTQCNVDIELELLNILFDMPEELESSNLAWYAPQEKRYFCAVDKQKYLLIEDNDLEYSLYGVNGNGKNLMLSSSDLREIDKKAQELAASWAQNRYMWDKSHRADWSNDRPTEKQLSLLAKIAPGLPLTAISKATASEIISACLTKKNIEPASKKQIYFLQRNGYTGSLSITKREAMRLIAEIKGVSSQKLTILT